MDIRKITRRTTRSKTQFINFNKEEISNLRLEANGNNNENQSKISDIEKVENSLNNENQCKISDIEKAENSLNNENQCKISDIEKVEKRNLCKNTEDLKPEDVFGKKVIFNNTPVRKYTPLTEKEERTYSFRELLDWVHKKEKRELFPKNKFDYVYKKSKNENTNQPEVYNEEKNIVHMRIEEDIIPCLSTNPFIQADKYFKQ